MPQPRVFGGSFGEKGGVTLYALWQRDDDKTNVLPTDLTDYDLVVYDLDDTAAPGAEVWKALTKSPTGVFLTLQPGVGAAPSGYTMKRQLKFGEADDTGRLWTSIGGHKYRFCMFANSALADVHRSRSIWELDCKQIITP